MGQGKALYALLNDTVVTWPSPIIHFHYSQYETVKIQNSSLDVSGRGDRAGGAIASQVFLNLPISPKNVKFGLFSVIYPLNS